MVGNGGQGLYVFALSSAYYRLIERDLLSIPKNSRAGIRLIGLGLEKTVDIELYPFILPYDHRFDGPDSPIRGTRSDFAQRAARHFVEELVANGIENLEEQKKQIKILMKIWRVPEIPKRESLNDEEVVAFIRKNSEEKTTGGSSRLLRALRDSGYRCEQKRFSVLYRKTVEGRGGRT
jgi:hypothetical protein